MKFKHLIPAAAVVAAMAGTPALAHTRLEASSPQANSVVSPAPAQLRLQFSDPLELPFSKVKLIDEQGAVINPSTIAAEPAHPNTWSPRSRHCMRAPTVSSGAPSPATDTRSRANSVSGSNRWSPTTACCTAPSPLR